MKTNLSPEIRHAILEYRDVSVKKFPSVVYDVCLCEVSPTEQVLCVFSFEEIDSDLLPPVPSALSQWELHSVCTTHSYEDESACGGEVTEHWNACLDAWEDIQEEVGALLSNPNITGVSFSADKHGPLILLFTLPRRYHVLGACPVPTKVFGRKKSWPVKRCDMTFMPCSRMSNVPVYRGDSQNSSVVQSTVGGYLHCTATDKVYGVTCAHGHDNPSITSTRIMSDRKGNTRHFGEIERNYILYGNVEEKSTNVLFETPSMARVLQLDAAPGNPVSEGKVSRKKGLDFSLVDCSATYESDQSHGDMQNLLPWSVNFERQPSAFLRNKLFQHLDGSLRPLHTRVVEGVSSRFQCLYTEDAGKCIEVMNIEDPEAPVLHNQLLFIVDNDTVEYQPRTRGRNPKGCSGSWLMLGEENNIVVGSVIRSNPACTFAVVCPLEPLISYLTTAITSNHASADYFLKVGQPIWSVLPLSSYCCPPTRQEIEVECNRPDCKKGIEQLELRVEQLQKQLDHLSRSMQSAGIDRMQQQENNNNLQQEHRPAPAQSSEDQQMV
jgi:hypothetical protein